jgi:hypothetical protein
MNSRRTFLRQSAVFAAAGCSRLTRAMAATHDLFVPPASAARGFRPLFDGKSLAGWHAHPRELNRPSLGLWAVENGVLIGGQSEPTFGAYLVTDETFQDFELTFESRTDYQTDTGIYLRTNAQGNIGYQVCIDYRPHGAINGYFGNGIGTFHACDYCFMPKRDSSAKVIRLIPEKPSGPFDALHHVPLTYAPPVERFLAAWSLHGWNHYRVRCEGKLPVLTTWINGLKAAVLETATMKTPGWPPPNLDKLLGDPTGHISLEVHSNGPNDLLGRDRWMPGGVCRWRNIQIKTL